MSRALLEVGSSLSLIVNDFYIKLTRTSEFSASFEYVPAGPSELWQLSVNPSSNKISDISRGSIVDARFDEWAQTYLHDTVGVQLSGITAARTWEVPAGWQEY